MVYTGSFNVIKFIECLKNFMRYRRKPVFNPDELVWNQMRNIGTSKKPLKKGESLKNRAILDLESIKNEKKRIQ